MIEIFTYISLRPPCLKDSRSPGLLKNTANKMSKMILLATPFTDPASPAIKTQFFSHCHMGEEEWEKLSSSSVSHSPDLRNKWAETGKMVLSLQDIWEKAH